MSTNYFRLIVLCVLFCSNFDLYAQNIEELKRKAEYSGDSWSMNKLAICYEDGEGVPRDMAKAIYWYTKAAEKGNDAAMYNLGLCYEYSKGVQKDEQKAYSYYLQSANNNSALAALKLGKVFENGLLGQSENKVRAANYYKDAAFRGNAEAMSCYGWCYANSYGVSKDIHMAEHWFELAIKNEYYYAYVPYCQLYLRDDEFEDPDMAIHLATQAEKYGYGNTAYNSIGCYYYDIINKKIKEDGFCYFSELALEYFEKTNNYSYGQFNIGLCYENGIGVNVDLDKALSYYTTALNLGNSSSLYRIDAICRNRGDLTTLFQILNTIENPKGSTLNKLAYMYAKGEGTYADFNKAIETIDRAIQLYPNELNYLDSKGEIYLIFGNERQARKIYQSILKKYPLFYSNEYINSELYKHFIKNN